MIHCTAKLASGEIVFVELAQSDLITGAPDRCVDVVFDSFGPGPIVVESRLVSELNDIKKERLRS